jgi:hypothetical protein
MQRRKVRFVLGFVCGAGALALCLVAGFRLVSPAVMEAKLQHVTELAEQGKESWRRRDRN